MTLEDQYFVNGTLCSLFSFQMKELSIVQRITPHKRRPRTKEKVQSDKKKGNLDKKIGYKDEGSPSSLRIFIKLLLTVNLLL